MEIYFNGFLERTCHMDYKDDPVFYIKMKDKNTGREIFFNRLAEDVWTIAVPNESGNKPVTYREMEKIGDILPSHNLLDNMEIIAVYDKYNEELPLGDIKYIKWQDTWKEDVEGKITVADHESITDAVGMTLLVHDVPDYAYECRYWSVYMRDDHTLQFVDCDNRDFVCSFPSVDCFLIDRKVFQNDKNIIEKEKEEDYRSVAVIPFDN